MKGLRIMPMLIPILLGVGLVALFAARGSTPKSAPPPAQLASGVQSLSDAEKLQLLASLPVRQVTNAQSESDRETLDLLEVGEVGGAGSANALSVIFGANSKDGYTILVGKPAGGPTKLLAAFKPELASSLAAVGGPWSIFLRPYEIESLATKAGVALATPVAGGGLGTGKLLLGPSAPAPKQDLSVALPIQGLPSTIKLPLSTIRTRTATIDKLPASFALIAEHYRKSITGELNSKIANLAGGDADMYRALQNSAGNIFADEATRVLDAGYPTAAGQLTERAGYHYSLAGK